MLERNLMIKSILLFLTAYPLLSSAQFSIVLPQSLRSNFTNRGIVNSTLGNFGHLAYGSNFLAKLFKPINNLDGCRPFKLDDFRTIDEEATYFQEQNYVVLVDRGGCTFVEKTLNVQKFGALAAIIVDNVKENTEYAIMIDANNQGDALHIPAYMIRYSDGELIKKVAENGDDDVMIRVSLEIGNDENEVEYDLWYANPGDFLTHEISQVTKVYAAISPIADFEPRVFTYSCVFCSEQTKKENCISNGKYCIFWPHIQDNNIIDYEDMKIQLFTEALTEKCLYKHLFEQDLGLRWFKYMTEFIDKCVKKDLQKFSSLNSDCSSKVMESLKMPSKEIKECVASSFEINGDFNSDNTHLKADSLKRDQVGVNLRPQVVINKFIYRGQFDYQDLFTAICSAFRPKPEECRNSYIGSQFKTEDSVSDATYQRGPRLAVVYEVVGALILVILFNIGMLFVFRNFQNKRRQVVIKEAVNSEVAKYFKISSIEDDGAKGTDFKVLAEEPSTQEKHEYSVTSVDENYNTPRNDGV